MPDIRIVPGSSIMSFTSSLNYIERITQDPSGSLTLYGSGSTGRTDLFSIDGNNGRLFSVSDDLSDSLFSVNTIAGLPVIEAFADNTVKMGQYGKDILVITGSSVGFGTATPGAFRLDAKGSGSIGALRIQKGTGGYLMRGLDGDGYTVMDVYGDIAGSNMMIALGDVDGAYSQPVLNISSGNSIFWNSSVGIDMTPSTTKLAIGGTLGLQAAALGSAATQILVTSADPSSTTRTVQTRTPSELRSDIGAGTGNGTVTSIATNNGVTGGTITSTGTIGLASAYGDTVNPYGSKTANTFLAAPNGSAGTPSFRAIAAADVPTLNQNTTGTATNATNIAITNDTATNATYYPVFAAATSGNTAARVDSSTLTYNPSTNTLTTGTFSGALSGNASTATTATNATNVTATTSATNSYFKIPFINHTGNTTGNYGLLQDSDSGTFTYNPNDNQIRVTTISGSAVNLNQGHALFNYLGICVLTAAAGTTISLGGGPGSVFNNVNVAKGSLAVNQSSPQGIFHVYQTASLGGTAGNNLILQTLQNTGGSGGNLVYIKDYAVRDATGTDWTTWRHHNSIDIDGSHNTPGTSTKTFWERDPHAGFHEFGHGSTYAVSIDAGNSRLGVATRTPSYPLHVNANVSSISIYASADIVAYSDQSVKENIRPIENVIERIQQSRGVLYDRTDIEADNNIGFIAQELEVAFPELVITNEDGTKAVKYQNTVAVLFEAIKEQQKQIDELKQIVNGITR